jgi:hypothetical protein
MLMVSSYAQDHVDACSAKVAAQPVSYREVLAAMPSEIDDFERQFFNHMVLALDHHGGQGRQSAERSADAVRWDHGKPGPVEREQDHSL